MEIPQAEISISPTDKFFCVQSDKIGWCECISFDKGHWVADNEHAFVHPNDKEWIRVNKTYIGTKKSPIVVNPPDVDTCIQQAILYADYIRHFRSDQPVYEEIQFKSIENNEKQITIIKDKLSYVFRCYRDYSMWRLETILHEGKREQKIYDTYIDTIKHCKDEIKSWTRNLIIPITEFFLLNSEMTVGDVVDYLNEFPPETPIVREIDHWGGFTTLNKDSFKLRNDVEIDGIKSTQEILVIEALGE
jgi:hypothetical protein